jgi:hypothetical protein
MFTKVVSGGQSKIKELISKSSLTQQIARDSQLKIPASLILDKNMLMNAIISKS